MSGGTSTSTTTNNIPTWLTDAAKSTFGKAESLFNTPYAPPPSPAERVAPFSGDQTNAFGMLRDYVASGGGAPGAAYGEGLNLIRNPGSGMDPYVDATLRPTIRNINEAATTERGRIGDYATTAGAYGDARHGVLEGQVGRNEDMAIGDATGRAYSEAWNQASARGGQLVDASTTGQNDFMSRLNALLGSGGQQQQAEQSGMDVGFQNYQAAQQSPYDKLAALVSTMSGAPYSRSSSTTTPTANPLWSILGSLAGGLI